MPHVVTVPRGPVAPPLAQRLDVVEARLGTLERRIRLFERYTAELDELKRVAGDLRFELEQMRP